ncbi:AAEL005366-PA [Aedes aegypti]|uniref:AAEL005366-PA n=1 Tax=Aedes aegypti TaxID=7159 RepID=Q17AA3_AEDAE|nr:AAEL005366-PA [Aedes aegypti]
MKLSTPTIRLIAFAFTQHSTDTYGTPRHHVDINEKASYHKSCTTHYCRQLKTIQSIDERLIYNAGSGRV